MKVSEIKESKVSQGALVFIYHKTKPYKTGWWRKIREGNTDNRTIYYILEKPMHKGYTLDKASENSHEEKGLCVMLDRTLKQGVDDNKYEIMAEVRGVDCVNLTLNDYDLTYLLREYRSLEHSILTDNVTVTSDFIELVEYYSPKPVNKLAQLAQELV